jgi:hypothetical protein
MKNDGVTDLTVGSNYSSSDLKNCFMEDIYKRPSLPSHRHGVRKRRTVKGFLRLFN